MRSGHLVGQRAMWSLWWVEGNTVTWVIGGDFRPEQWAWFRSVVELRGLLSGAVALVSSGVVSWEVRCTRHIAGWVFRCCAVVPGGCMAASHMDGSHMSGETSGCCTVVVQVRSHTEEIWSCRSVGAIRAAVALVCLHTTGSHMYEEIWCGFAVRLCLYTTGWYMIGYKVERRAAGARAQLRMTEETLKCYVVAAAAAAADYAPKAHNWPGAARWADSLHNPGLFPDAEIALSHSAHMTTFAGALSEFLPLRDAAGAHSGPAEARLSPVGRMMGAFRVVFP